MMLKNIFYYLPLLVALFLGSCTEPDPNKNESGKDELKSLEINEPLTEKDIIYNKDFYVPIYSDVYINALNQKSLLAATLSIRNTSYQDSLFVNKIEYFNTHGDLVREYIKKPISLKPMATVNYVIEKEDDLGGSGANFIVGISARSNAIKPMIQAIMIGENTNKGFAFTTEASPIN